VCSSKYCGNGKVEFSEICDDHNVNSGDGCNSTCSPELGYLCTTVLPNPSVCVRACGNGQNDTIVSPAYSE